MTLAPAVFVVTAVLTSATFLVALFMAGPGFLLYLAMLGGAAAWLLPGLVAQALPCGLFGGTLVAAAGPASEERVRPAAVVGATCLLTVAALALVGWLAPQGYQATAAATARYRTGPSTASRDGATARPPQSPAALELPALMADASDGARGELWRRLLPVVATFVLGVVAAGVVGSGARWSTRTALVATAVVFAIQMSDWIKSFPV